MSTTPPSGLTQTGVHELMRMMIEQNQQRDQMLADVMSRLGTGRQFSMLPDLKHSIRNFDGETSNCSEAEDWLNSVETTANLHNWPVEYKLQVANTTLTGAARNWFLTNQNSFKGWTKFEESFREMFMAEIGVAEKWRRMNSRKQSKDETIFAYVHDKIRLCNDLKLNSAETKKMICIGLHSKELCNILLSKNHSSTAMILTDIRQFDEVVSERNEKWRVPKPGIQNKSGSPKEALPTENNMKTENSIKTNGIRCFNCNNVGHLSRNCDKPRKPMKCTLCGLEGHYKKYCTNSKITPTVSFVETKFNKSKYIKRVKVNDFKDEVFGLIDTGCDICLMKNSVAEILGLKVCHTERQLTVYGNTKSNAVIGVTSAQLQIDTVAEQVELWVVTDSSQDYDLLIGRTFTDKENVTFVKTQNEVIFGYNFTFPFENDEINKTETTVFGVKDDQITEDMIECGSTLSDSQRSKLMILINNYRNCFALRLQELGCTDILKMNIEDQGPPVQLRPYKTSEAERNQIDAIVNEWKSVGIATETDSEYASPVMVISKKNGEPRLVVDYRQLNNQTIKTNFPVANLDDQLEDLAGARMYCSLDLASGYLQVPLTEEAKRKSAFITQTQTGQFERMMFGLTNAPYIFSKLMAKVLGKLPNKIAKWYLDDILIPAKDFPEMLERLELVFKALQEAKLTLKLRKCKFACDTVPFLGFMLTPEGLKPGSEKTHAICNFPQPRNKHEVRRFLGLTGFFRRFVPAYAVKVQPISDLLKKDVDFNWGQKQEVSFTLLKTVLTNNPVLQLYNQTAETELHCDASAEGLSGMLLQRGEDQNLHLVYAVSKKTTITEKMYHSSRLELMAIVWSVTRLRHLLIGIHFTIITDCQALVHLNAKKTQIPQIARWASLLSEYDYDIRHRPGDKMCHIDALSRAPVEEANDTMNEIVENLEVLMVTSEADSIVAMQHSDSKLTEIIKLLKSDKRTWTNQQKTTLEKYLIKNEMLYRKVDGKELWEVPNSMRKSITVKFHDLSGHFAVDHTVSKIKEKYYFPKMRRYVKYHINACPECLLRKIPRGKRPGELHPITPGKRPFEIVNMDHIGPFLRSTKGNNFVLVIIDNLTKFVKLYAVSNTNAQNLLRCVKLFVLSHGLPRRIISDRGTCFTSKIFGDFCTESGIQHSLISVRHPQANGQVERVNATLVPVIQANMTTERSWDRELTKVECQLNNSYNKTIGDTPFKVLYGYYANFVDGALSSMVVPDQGVQNVRTIQEKVREQIMAEHQQWKLRYDKGHSTNIHYSVGEIVYLRRSPEQTGDSTKLQDKFRGPMVILQTLPGDTYAITSLSNRGNPNYSTKAHVSKLKAYHLPEEEDDNEDNEEEPETEESHLEEDKETNIDPRPKRQPQRPSYLKDYIQ